MLKCRAVGSNQFDHKDIEELSCRLARSFEKYGDKDKILIVNKRVIGNHLFRKLRHQPGVEELALDSISRILPQPNATNTTTETPLPIQATDQGSEYTTAEVESVARIRDFWRKRLPGLLQHRKYLSTPEGQIFRRYSGLCTSHRSSPKIYIALLSSGVEACLKVDNIRHSLQLQRERIMRDIDIADPSEDKYEALDGYLQSVRDLEYELNNQASQMSTSSLAEILEKGKLRGLRQVLGTVEGSIAAAESGLAHIVTDMGNV